MIVDPQIAIYSIIAYLPLVWVAWGNNKLLGVWKLLFSVLSPIILLVGVMVFVYGLKSFWPELLLMLTFKHNAAFLVLPAIISWYLFKITCEFILPNKPHPYWGE